MWKDQASFVGELISPRLLSLSKAVPLQEYEVFVCCFCTIELFIVRGYNDGDGVHRTLEADIRAAQCLSMSVPLDKLSHFHFCPSEDTSMRSLLWQQRP